MELEEALAEIKRLEGLLSGDATLVQASVEDGLSLGIKHPLVALMADSLAKTIGDNNYVEMSMKHRDTGIEYRVQLQRQDRPTPHELRRQAEARVIEMEKELRAVRELYAKESCARAEVAPPKRDPDYYYDFTENKMYGSLKDAKRRGCIEKDLIPLYAFTVTTTSGSV